MVMSSCSWFLLEGLAQATQVAPAADFCSDNESVPFGATLGTVGLTVDLDLV